MKKFLLVLLASFAFSFNTFAAVNINTATQAELETLDGIGPVKAQAIIDYRKKNGAFKSTSDLEKVDGIGPGTVEKLRGSASTSGTTTVVAPNNVKSEKPGASKAKSADQAKPVKEPSLKPKANDTMQVGTDQAASAGKTAESKVTKEKAPIKDKAVDKKSTGKVEADKQTKDAKETDDGKKAKEKPKADKKDKSGKTDVKKN